MATIYHMTLYNMTLSLSKVTLFQYENALLTLSTTLHVRARQSVFFHTRGHAIFMTRRYQLHNSDVIR